MRKMRYQVYVCVSISDSGDPVVEYGYCQCPIGLAQACSHIGSLLFALSNAKIADVKVKAKGSCTDELCQWNVPRLNVTAKPMSELSNKKPLLPLVSEVAADHKETPNLSNVDPRHTDDCNEPNYQTLQHLRDLKDIFLNTGMSHLWNIPDHVPDIHEEVEVHTTVHPLFTKMQKMIFSKENVPPLTIDRELIDYIEVYTRSQRLSEMWRKLHIGRLTSSLFGAVLNAGDNPRSLVQQIVEGSSLEKYKTLPPAVQWGVEHECKARADYSDLRKLFCEQLKVEETGLTLCESHSFIGASSDGRITDDDSVGALEVKCPYSLGGTLINYMEVLDIVAMNHKDFCLESSTDGVVLKKKTQILQMYAQVQGEMAVMGLPWCDFVVWTAAPQNNICIDRVYSIQILSAICFQN